MQDIAQRVPRIIPFFGARALARKLLLETDQLRSEGEILKRERDEAQSKIAGLGATVEQLTFELEAVRAQHEIAQQHLTAIGAASMMEVEAKRCELQAKVDALNAQFVRTTAEIAGERDALRKEVEEAQGTIVETRETALLQEVGIYEYRHPLTDVLAYENALDRLQDAMKAAAKRDGGAVLAATNWTVNGSEAEGRKMTREISKLMLRAFNAEADNLVRGLKPYKLQSAVERLKKVEDTIRRLGITMQISVSPAYVQLRIDELELTADFLQKQAEEKEAERQERERMREERKAQQEMERERSKLAKERQHYENALLAVTSNGDADGMLRLQEQIAEVDKAIDSVDARAANTRAGYVYVISNIGSFGEKMVKVGMTRRLDPMERIRELSDASVPFNFDVHALFFSNDAVGIETSMHDRLADCRVNAINRRREFFRATPLEVKTQLGNLTGELLEFREVAEAIEYRQTIRLQHTTKV
ncbi:DUF4041 domain-containing protein [Bradyrhizobium elkanii]|uniref:DUF4041 domain-containing protein n=1 Tax=Bradyrhizobium elkanii TaxID=29448 RepID=UPI00216AB173|nr:DUF4041 domain-containing protein [Bradyrhizobium elkanii]MCS3519287.1 chromosome segregation ATPase [Bradyrhizobium elkanii]MCS4066944.1 hypothetical protein [Bradyrhizobium elkanii]MCS4082479.1 chromosome segregation ATPase [Bradyrhizobium elkanii]MCW2127902.1 hypothetical protein [Bradyrhizobium elkanii]MCW2174645.1 hypothetical protein [Bradyrhizobium elkanii]